MTLVRRLQGRVHACRSALLLPTDDHRFRQRYLFACEALSTTKEAYAFPVFEAVFKEYGLPKAIQTDDGLPFATPNSLGRLSNRLSTPAGSTPG
jgi:hypothetical protein